MISNPIRRFIIIPRFATGHILHWEIDPVADLGTDYDFTVEVADDPTFSEVVYEVPAGKAMAIVDNSNDKQSWSYDRYYRIRTRVGVDTVHSRAVMFGTQPSSQFQYRNAAEIIRKELLRMKRFTGQDGWLLKRKVTGKPAESKYIDEISGVPMADTTSEFNTGLEGGYYPPIPMWYTYEEFQQTKELVASGFGVNEDITVKFRTIGYPLIEVRDIMVNRETDSRYNVMKVDAFSFPGTNIIVVQTITVKRIPPTDTVYKIQMPLKHEFIIP